MNSTQVGRYIRTLRIKAGLTQEQIADMLMVSRQAVSKWENGVAVPDVLLLPKLSKVLDMDIEGILFGAPHDISENIVGVVSLWSYLEADIFPTDFVFDKPLLIYPISMLMLCSIKKIVLTGPLNMLENAKKALGEYTQSGLGIDILFAESVSEYVGKHIVILAGNSYLYGIDLTRFLQRTIVRKEEMSIIACNVDTINVEDLIYRNYDNKLTEYNEENIIDKDIFLKAFPFLSIRCADSNLLSRLSNDKNNFVKKLINCDLSKKEIYVETIGRGMLSFEIKNREDLHNFSKTIEYISKTQHCEISNLSEIAKRRFLD